MNQVESYLHNLTDEYQKKTLQHVRKVILSVCPDAEEAISYGMPAAKYKKKYLIGYCNFKQHLSIFPGGEVIAELGKDLVGFTTAKGTIQFTQEQPLPDDILTKVIVLRMQAIDAIP